MSPVLIILLNTNCKPSIVTLTLNVNPTLFVIPCNFLGDYGFPFLQCMSLTKWFFIQISTFHMSISSQVADERMWGCGQWMNSSIIYDNICKLIHKNCHPNSYHSDIKYHMTLNFIFSVVTYEPVQFEK